MINLKLKLGLAHSLTQARKFPQKNQRNLKNSVQLVSNKINKLQKHSSARYVLENSCFENI